MELFKAFRGREPKVDALLRHSGIGTAIQSAAEDDAVVQRVA
jgi:hypothetical protein